MLGFALALMLLLNKLCERLWISIGINDWKLQVNVNVFVASITLQLPHVYEEAAMYCIRHAL